jgi:hypothetical protein
MQFERGEPPASQTQPREQLVDETRGVVQQDRDLNPGGQTRVTDFEVIARQFAGTTRPCIALAGTRLPLVSRKGRCTPCSAYRSGNGKNELTRPHT